MRVLNLGAGNKRIDGAVNHDLRPDLERPWLDVYHDLNNMPWPWVDDAFDIVMALSVFEHLRCNLLDTLNECWRILAPDGVLTMKLPYWDSDVSYQDITHYWRFSLRSLDQFDPQTKRGQQYRFYTERKWRITQSPALNESKSSIIVKMQVRK